MPPARIALDWEVVRLRVLFGAMLFGFAVVGAALWRLQVAHSENYRRDLARQSVRRVRVPAARGRIYDRAGAPLAENRPSYAVAFYLEELRQRGALSRTVDRVEATLAEMERLLGRPREIARADIEKHLVRRRPMPLLAWRDLDERAIARWAEHAADLPGVDIETEAVRVYAASSRACHVVGYVGRAAATNDASAPFHYGGPEMAGRSGVERVYDRLLRGAPGGRLLRVDASGYRRGELDRREPRAGADLRLTLDLRAQDAAAAALDGRPGAAVVLDPRNGDVLALVSEPGFDPNAFVPSLPAPLWAALRDDERRPMFNRAVSGAYPPGSTFKPVTAVAALSQGAVSPATSWDCPGYFLLGKRTIRCWDRGGHGAMSLRAALRHSCNVYFFHAALAAGPDAVVASARAAGLGRPSGIDLDGEAAGLVPDRDWKRRAHRDDWRDGDTCNLAIGQGALLATPLQMAVVAAAVANAGRVPTPRLLGGVRDPGQETFRPVASAPLRDLAWDPSAARLVREGMRDVVMAEDGTGRKARIEGVTAAGKTGTAEYGPRDARRNRGWMIAFAPYDAPHYAIAVVLEDAESGGTTVAPVVRRILEGLFRVEAEPGREADG